MSQHALELTPRPGSVLEGAAAFYQVEDIFKALASLRKGNSRPSDIQVGEVWICDVSEPWVANLWDGDQDIPVFSVDPTAHSLAFAGLEIGTNLQAWSSVLDLLAALSPTSGKIPYFTGSPTVSAALANLGAFGLTLLALTSAAGGRTALELGTAAQATLGTGDAQIPNMAQVLAAIAANAQPGGLNGFAIFDTAGTSSWTVPTGITKVKVTVIGGGGGYFYGGGGYYPGGGGGFAQKIVSVTPEDSISYTVGAAGINGSAGNNIAYPGGTTSFGSLLTAPGGGGGIADNSTSLGGVPTNSGALNINGSKGISGGAAGSLSGDYDASHPENSPGHGGVDATHPPVAGRIVLEW